MKLAIIAPPTMLKWCDKGDIHMCLAHMLATNTTYREYYKRVGTESGHGMLIMDNGAAEGQLMHAEQLMDLADEVGADEIIMPDQVNDGLTTVELTRAAMEKIPNPRMVVPQGKTLREWLDCLESLVALGMFSTIGVSKYCPVPRDALLHHLERSGHHRKHRVHLLGIAGDPREIDTLSQTYPWVRSVDTAAPVAYGLHLQTVRSFNMTGHLRFAWDVAAPLESSLVDPVIEHNIMWMKRWAKGLGDTDAPYS